MGAAPDYDLPESAIAQVPAEPRDAARLLVDRGSGHPPDHRHVRDLPGLLGEGDVLVLNESKVLPARLRLRKAGPGAGAVEVLLLERDTDGDWTALVRPGRRVRPGTVLLAGDEVVAEVGEELGDGRRRVRLAGAGDAVLHEHGEVALPPYVRTALDDPDRYQTVYARHPGSVAAPTAGLHLTEAVLDRCRDRGVRVVAVDLAVGLDTFRPVTAERLEDHPVHAERYRVPEATVAACEGAHRVVAVGTTTVRALETAAATGELEGDSRLLVTPGHRWHVVDALLTNFHLPRSTLLLLVEALIGPRWRNLYALALAEGYRFLSFGDAMFLERRAE